MALSLKLSPSRVVSILPLPRARERERERGQLVQLTVQQAQTLKLVHATRHHPIAAFPNPVGRQLALELPSLLVSPGMMKPGGVIVSSSPGREKLPAPPGLLSRKASGSRSRGRSASAARSSPMFVSRSGSLGRSSSAAATAAEEGEPSSPKVTCIGQVRIRSKRSAKPKTPKCKKARSKSSLMPCRCFHGALLCSLFAVRKRPTGGKSGGGGRRSLWRGWARIRTGGSWAYKQRNPEPVRRPPPTEFVGDGKATPDREEVEDVEETAAPEQEETRVFVPPKNALLLMRCRSAPHNRASSLATARFAGPPLPAPEPPAAEQQEEATEASGRGEEQHQQEEGDAEDDVEARGSESQRPLVLPRSKSEPARRTSAKLTLPEASYCFWTSSNSSGGRRRRPSPSPEERGSLADA
ncbi:unnamed protein product [Musa hybrid cultivar]